MKKLLPFRKTIMIVGIVFTLIAAVLFFIFGKPEEKLSTLSATVLTVPLVYLFVKFMFFIGVKKGKKLLAVYTWFFMIFGIIAILMGTITFFQPFPANSVPLISCGFTLVTSILFHHARLEQNLEL